MSDVSSDTASKLLERMKKLPILSEEPDQLAQVLSWILAVKRYHDSGKAAHSFLRQNGQVILQKFQDNQINPGINVYPYNRPKDPVNQARYIMGVALSEIRDHSRIPDKIEAACIEWVRRFNQPIVVMKEEKM